MRLRDLEPKFLKLVDSNGSSRIVDSLAEADGLWFLCPKCFAKNGGAAGVHGIKCWFEGKVPPTAQPGPGRWIPNGTGIDDLTFTSSISPSIQLLGGCRWHGWIENGCVRGDS